MGFKNLHISQKEPVIWASTQEKREQQEIRAGFGKKNPEGGGGEREGEYETPTCREHYRLAEEKKKT